VCSSDVYSWALLAIQMILHKNTNDSHALTFTGYDKYEIIPVEHDSSAPVRINKGFQRDRDRIQRHLLLEGLTWGEIERDEQVTNQNPAFLELCNELLNLLQKCLDYDPTDAIQYGRPKSDKVLSDLKELVTKYKKVCPYNEASREEVVTRVRDYLTAQDSPSTVNVI
jgi:hypothetical protein